MNTSAITDATSELTPYARMSDAAGDVIDAVVEVDRLVQSLTAARAQMVDQARQWVELAESKGRRASKVTWDDRTTAHRVLVSELACALRISENAAERLVFESDCMTQKLPATLEALREGTISYRHAAVMIEQVMSLPEEARAAFEQVLLPAACDLSVPAFARKARREREKAHPESIATRKAEQVDRRSVTIEPGRDGMAWLTAYVPAEQAVAIDDRLNKIAASLCAPDEERTFAQLRADAFCDLVINGATNSVGWGVRAEIMVTVPVLTLLGHSEEPGTLEGYGPIDPETARRLAADAPSFTRILTHPETGAVLSVGRDRYAVPADLRRALRARDETCRMVGCGRRAANCDVDHTTAWEHDGETVIDNLAHLCRRHHNLKHRTDWTMTQKPGGTIQWTSPSGRTYMTEPATRLRT